MEVESETTLRLADAPCWAKTWSGVKMTLFAVPTLALGEEVE
jgi:hypothetical protein